MSRRKDLAPQRGSARFAPAGYSRRAIVWLVSGVTSARKVRHAPAHKPDVVGLGVSRERRYARLRHAEGALSRSRADRRCAATAAGSSLLSAICFKSPSTCAHSVARSV